MCRRMLKLQQQKMHDNGNKDGECVAICSPFSYKNYQNNLCQKNNLSVYDRNNLNLVKSKTFETKELQAFNLNGIIFFIGRDNSISYWDIINESKQLQLIIIIL
ncbi:hypothetical protein TTHERM_01553980 (macronuclear) [Tetrahymena thermophila SB210]|uniref:Uncharacterized protein n=1 Tax=Tetrahymena thermophila (strain SB210) TaxID=312017 RepID=Q228J6_TETTS|nr:hypothetical protein TTHERM_01553980 [Tetrahymena thermophila SB210]EAR81711.2 hypothetical protein TTHERM_01553980 [Tetrahymena thermophila SB210]|eukprot:XP_001029374.2 hypothetical protein TTHERM_01553980 [Tetrahymena thermophila SB210]